jgi:mRNA interferase RelE/StbE
MRARVARLGDDPRPRNSRVVVGWSERTYRVRVGEYRVLYEIHDDEVVVLVVRVAHRKDAYGLREHEEPYHLETAARA